jgi:hypothetical protein
MENLVIRVFGKIDYELEKSKKVLDEVPHYVIKIDKINNIIYKLLELLLRLLEI